MNFFQFLEKELELAIRNPDYPIMAGANFASRESGLAIGISGLEWTTGRNLWKPIKQKREIENIDIFSAELKFEESQISFLDSLDNRDVQKIAELGDLFSGLSNQVWSQIVLNLPITHIQVSDSQNEIVRAGLAHGELIRDFTKWILDSGSPKPNFSTSESKFESNGWCNGNSGFLVISCLVQIEMGLTDIPKDLFVQFDKIFDSLATTSVDNLDSGLCHGTSGILVTLAGVARFLKDNERLIKVQTLFEEIFSSGAAFQLDPQRDLDCSWLTGMAGLLWAQKVLHEKPVFNPLVPFDSTTFLPIRRKP